MNVYEGFRRKIAGPTVPLPIFFRADLSIDHAGIERYIAWLLEAGITNMCLTYGYSQIGSVSPTEVLDVTRTIANIVGDRAAFISCTSGVSAVESITVVQQMQKVGAHAAFVMPNLMSQAGPAYRDLLCYVAGATELAILFVSYPAPNVPGTPNLSVDDYKLLLEHDNIVGLKEDYNDVAYRMELIRNFGDRLCIIGGGVLRNYLFFHHYPQQGELAGMFNAGRALRFLKLLDEDRLNEALEFMERQARAIQDAPADLDWLARNQVRMQVMGFAETWQMRPPLASATEEQAQDLIVRMRQYPDVFEL